MEANEPLKEWEEFVDLVNELSPSRLVSSRNRWIFRGQTNVEWPLTTSLDRALNRFMPPVVDRRPAETFLLREFRRHFHRYSQYAPHEDDILEWLSLMQHHGAPTRLLDWTYSPYVALYFAIESAKENSDCLVWAVNQTDCWDMFKEKLSDEDKSRLEKDDKDREVVNKVLHSFPYPMLCPLNPFHLNTRLTIQQGTFLVPLGRDLSFEENFNGSIGTGEDSWKKIRITCSRKFLERAFTELQRVNIGEVNLFPGIDGLARSLRITMLLRHLHPYV